tara:strand:- start:383 stop:514 length:132 start_codon:yes stop_codon:yes gene_type:complete
VAELLGWVARRAADHVLIVAVDTQVVLAPTLCVLELAESIVAL